MLIYQKISRLWRAPTYVTKFCDYSALISKQFVPAMDTYVLYEILHPPDPYILCIFVLTVCPLYTQNISRGLCRLYKSQSLCALIYVQTFCDALIYIVKFCTYTTSLYINKFMLTPRTYTRYKILRLQSMPIYQKPFAPATRTSMLYKISRLHCASIYNQISRLWYAPICPKIL